MEERREQRMGEKLSESEARAFFGRSKPDPSCPACRGTGVVQRDVPTPGRGMVAVDIPCACWGNPWDRIKERLEELLAQRQQRRQERRQEVMQFLRVQKQLAIGEQDWRRAAFYRDAVDLLKSLTEREEP